MPSAQTWLFPPAGSHEMVSIWLWSNSGIEHIPPAKAKIYEIKNKELMQMI